MLKEYEIKAGKTYTNGRLGGYYAERKVLEVIHYMDETIPAEVKFEHVKGFKHWAYGNVETISLKGFARWAYCDCSRISKTENRRTNGAIIKD